MNECEVGKRRRSWREGKLQDVWRRRRGLLLLLSVMRFDHSYNNQRKHTAPLSTHPRSSRLVTICYSMIHMSTVCGFLVVT